MTKRADAVGVALQIAYEYEGWGPAEVGEMLDTYEASGEPAPCTYDELMELTLAADKLKKSGLSFQEAETQMLKGR